MLKIAESQNQDRFYDQKEQLDITRATLQAAMSHVGFDEETRQFEATLDKLIFKNPFEVISTVLGANGFTINLENMLAALDQWRFGVRARLNGKDVEDGRPSPRQYLPAARFGLPEKNKTGEWLKLFYREIEVYEEKLGELEGKGAKKHAPGESPAELKEEIRKLRQENTELSARIREMVRKLNETQRSQASMHRALEAQNYLPESLKLGVVKEVMPEERQIVVRTGRKTISVPLAIMHALPEPENPCLLKLDDSQATAIFLYEGQNTPFTLRPAEVLFTKTDLAKFRDEDRRIFLVRADNAVERQRIASLKRGDRVLLYLTGERLVRFDPARVRDPGRFAQHMQEAIAVQQIRHFLETSRNRVAKNVKGTT